MEPTDPLTPALVVPGQRAPESHAALDALRDPLAAILGRAQMLERRILQGEAIAPDDHLATLAHIQRSVWDLEHKLRAIQSDEW